MASLFVLLFYCPCEGQLIINSENFDKSTHHWSGVGSIGNPASGGVGDTAFLQGDRSVSTVIFDANRSSPWKTTALKFANDWVDAFGDSGGYGGVRIGFYLKRLNGYGQGAKPVVILYEDAAMTKYWQYQFEGPIDSFWTYYDVVVNLNWTDDQAAAAGWVAGGAVSSWSTLMSNEIYNLRITHDETGYGSNLRSLGLDWVKVESVETEAGVEQYEDFSLATHHWGGVQTLTNQSTGGLADTAFCQVDRSSSTVIFDADRSNPWKTTALKFANDWVDTFGGGGQYDHIDIGFSLKRLNAYGGGTKPSLILYEDSSQSKSWSYDFNTEVDADWTAFQLTVDLDWTDGQAQAAGWVRNGAVSS